MVDAAEPKTAARSRWSLPRLLFGAAAGWTTAYAAGYLVLLSWQARQLGDDGGAPQPAWWYVALLAIAAVSLITATTLPARSPLPGGLALLLLLGCTLPALLTIGVLLLPAVALTATATAMAWQPHAR